MKLLSMLLIAAMGIQVSLCAQATTQNTHAGQGFTQQQELSIHYQVPCLTVRGETDMGKLSYLPVRLTRTKDNKPLRIMIIDDTPNGSGNTIHSSIWLAAITAAMLRNDTLHGVTISVEFSGNVDGPSAGGVTCLAVLSAIDGLKLPDDFAMTGTILPDGTIGVVGGVAAKMKAAAQAGKKRIIIPAFQRIDVDSKGKEIDLQHLADELKITLYRVENISEAYALLHNKPYQGAGYVNIRTMTRLPRKMENELKVIYKDYLQKVKEERKANPKAQEDDVLPEYTLSPELAITLYQEGKFYSAVQQILRTWQAWQVHKAFESYIDNFFKQKNPDWNQIKYLREYHYRKLLSAGYEETDKFRKKAAETYGRLMEKMIEDLLDKKDFNGYIPNKAEYTEITAQLEQVEHYERLHGLLEMFESRRMTPDEINHASLKELEEAWRNEAKLLYIVHLFIQDPAIPHSINTAIGGTMPKLKANSRAAEVERLFYSASDAAANVAGQNFQDMVSCSNNAQEEARITEEEITSNPHFLPFLKMYDSAVSVHEGLLPDAPKKATFPAYHTQASLKTQVAAFAKASAILVIYGPDGSNDFIPHLLRNARTAAIRNISECVNAGIPCPDPIYDFEMAENAGQSDSDIAEMLMAYWRASLYAKALLMSFNTEK